MPGASGAIPLFRNRKRRTRKEKKAALKKSIRNTLPQVFVKSIIYSPSIPEKSSALSPDFLPALPAVESEGKLCQKCQGKVDEPKDDALDYEMHFNGLSDDTVLVSHQLKMLKEQRRKFEEQQKLNEVLERVQAALDYSGIKFDENDAPMELPTFQNDMFSIQGRKQKSKERTFIYDMFEQSETLGRTRDGVIQDVENWFAVSCDDLESFCNLKLPDADDENIVSDDYFVRIHKAFRRSTDSINKLIAAMQRALPNGQSKSLGARRRTGGSRSKVALQVPSSITLPDNADTPTGTEKIDPENKSSQESVNESKIKINSKKIYTENELNNWNGIQSAMKVFMSLLADGAKNSNNAQTKNLYKMGTKQLKILMPVIERKMGVVSELEDKVKTLSNEATSLKFDQQQRAADKTQIRKLSDENQKLREEIAGLRQYLHEQEAQQNQSQYESAQRIASRHVSIKLPEETDSVSADEHIRSVSGSVEVVAEVDVIVDEMIEEDDVVLSVTNMRENLKKKLSSRRSMQHYTSSRVPSRNAPSQQNVVSKQSILVPVPTAQPVAAPVSAAKFSKLELYDYDSESVSSHEQFESVVKKSEHFQTDQLRQQIHMLREELRQSDDRYYEQREELENLRLIVTSQSTAKSDHTFKDKEKNYENKIETLQVQQKLLKKELGDKKQDLTKKQQQIENLQEQIRELLKEREASKPNGEQILSDKSIEPPKVQIPVTIDISQMPRDQLIAKITRQSEQELNRLRKFIVREQQRFQANLRRNNLEANKQLAKLRNDHNVMSRAVVHFKDTINRFLQDDPESIAATADAVNSIHDSASLLSIQNTESFGGDTSVDALVALERRLYNIFMQKRLVIKHTNASKVNTEKEVEQLRFQLQKRTLEFSDQQQHSKRVEVRNDVLTKQCKQLSYLNQSLQKELEPCKDLMRKYTSIQEQVERLKATEREQERDTKQLTKELEADRTRLKKEINQLTLAQICPLKKNAPNKLWSRLTCAQKKEVIDKAYTMNQLTTTHHDASKEILDYCNELVLVQFSNIVKQYMNHCRINRIKQSIKSIAARYENDTRFNTYLEGRMKLFEHSKIEQKNRSAAVKADRAKAFYLLKQVLGESFDGFIVPSIQLSKPTYPKPLKNHPQENTTRKPNEPINKVVGNIVGKALSTENKTNGQSYWQMPPNVPENLVQITVPRMLAMDVEKCQRMTIAKNLKNRKTPFLPPIASLYPY